MWGVFEVNRRITATGDMTWPYGKNQAEDYISVCHAVFRLTRKTKHFNKLDFGTQKIQNLILLENEAFHENIPQYCCLSEPTTLHSA